MAASADEVTRPFDAVVNFYEDFHSDSSEDVDILREIPAVLQQLKTGVKHRPNTLINTSIQQLYDSPHFSTEDPHSDPPCNSITPPNRATKISQSGGLPPIDSSSINTKPESKVCRPTMFSRSTEAFDYSTDKKNTEVSQTSNVKADEFPERLAHTIIIDQTSSRGSIEPPSSGIDCSRVDSSSIPDDHQLTSSLSESILLDTVASLKHKIADLYAELEALRCSHSQTIEHENDLKEVVNSLRRSRDWYEQQLSIAHTMRSQMDAETERLHALLKESSDNNHKLVHENACLQAELACSRASLADAKRSLSHQLEAIRVDMIEREALFQRIAKERADLEEVSLKRSEHLNSLQADIDSLKADLKASDTLANQYELQLQELKQRLRESEAACSSNQELLNSKEVKMAQMVDELDAKVEQLTAATARIASLDHFISLKDSEMSSLIEQNNSISAALSAANKEKITLDSHIVSLKDKLSQIDERFEAVQMESQAKSAQLSLLTEEREQLLSQIETFSRQTPDMQNIITILRRENEALVHRLRSFELETDRDKTKSETVGECYSAEKAKRDAEVQIHLDGSDGLRRNTTDRAVGADLPIGGALTDQKPDLLSPHVPQSVFPHFSPSPSQPNLYPISQSSPGYTGHNNRINDSGMYNSQNNPESYFMGTNVVVTALDGFTSPQFDTYPVSFANTNHLGNSTLPNPFVPASDHSLSHPGDSLNERGVSTHPSRYMIERDSSHPGSISLSDYFSNSSEPFLETSTHDDIFGINNAGDKSGLLIPQYAKHSIQSQEPTDNVVYFTTKNQEPGFTEEFSKSIPRACVGVQCDTLQHENEQLRQQISYLNQSLVTLEADLALVRAHLSEQQALLDHERRSHQSAAEYHQQSVAELNSVREVLSQVQLDYESLRQEKHRLQMEAYEFQHKHTARSDAHSDEMQALKAIIKTTTNHLAKTTESFNRAQSEKLQYQSELARLRGGIRAQLERFRLFTRPDASGTVRATIANSTGPLVDIFTSLGIDMNGLEELLEQGNDFSLTLSKPIQKLDKCFESLQTEIKNLEDQVVHHALAVHDTFGPFPSTTDVLIIPHNEQTAV